MLDFLLITLKKAFDTWKTDWTASRAQKIDTIESRLSSTRMSILDGLNNRLSSIEKALNGKVNQVSIENLTKKVDGVISAIASKASQTSLDSLKKIVEDLSSRLTSARVQKLDNLDTTVSSRADQTTASSILSKVNQGMVKRVQRGEIRSYAYRPDEWIRYYNDNNNGETFYIDITLPYAVDMQKAKENCTYSASTRYHGDSITSLSCQLINSRTLRIYKFDNRGISEQDRYYNTFHINWIVEEWY